MSVILDDDFTSYAVGTGLPFGPWSGGGTVQGFGANPSINRSVSIGTMNTFFVEMDKGLLSFGFGFGSTTVPLNGIILELINGDGGPASTNFLLGLGLDPDLGLSLFSQNGMLHDDVADCPANSILTAGYSLPPAAFHFIQIEFAFEIGDDNIVKVGAAVAVDGNVYLNASGSTGIDYHHLFIPGNVVNGMQFSNPIFSSLCVIANVTLDNDPTSGIPHPTIPNKNIVCLISQIPIEYGYKPTVPAKGRLSQLVLEYGATPINRARVSQIVLEIIGKNIPQAPGGWEAKES